MRMSSPIPHARDRAGLRSGSRQTGTITAVAVEVGDQVKTGQALATIDASDLQLQQAQATQKAAEDCTGSAARFDPIDALRYD